MKNFLLVFILLFSISVVNAQQWRAAITKENPTFFEMQDAFNQYWKPYNVVNGKYIENGVEKKAYGWKQFKRWEWYWEPRVDKNGLFPEAHVNYIALADYQKNHPEKKKVVKATANWEFMGSDNSWGGYAGIGRVNCIAFHPSDNQTFWIGSAGGGVWKTTNNGGSWTSLTDDIPVIAISDIAVDPTNPDVIYIATGDSDGSYGSAGSVPSNGVYKTINGGLNWNATGLSYNVTNQDYISRLLIDPTNPQVLLASASNGIWRTADGGANWTHPQTSGKFRDMEFKPTDNNYIYAATFSYSENAKIYRSTDNGNSWSIVHSFSSVTRAAIAVSNADPNLVDVLAVNADWGLEGLYSSSNSGATFSNYFAASCSTNYLNSNYDASDCDGQGYYDVAFEINPTNVNEKWIGGINTWKSTDGGQTWTLNNFWNASSSQNPNSVPVVHADKHFFKFSPLTNSLYECNDGGLYFTQDGGGIWNDISNGLGIGQIYKLATSATQADNVMCGLQDNGSKEITNLIWEDVTSGDGMECIIDYTDPSIEYGTYTNGQISKTINDWGNSSVIVNNNGSGVDEEGAWVTPYLMHPTDNNTLIIGKSQVYKTTDGGGSWSQLATISGISGKIKAMAYAPSNPQYIYVATNNEMFRTVNGGTNWSSFATSAEAITYIAVDPLNPDRIWYTQSGYSATNKVKYYNGTTWTDFSGTLPNVPVNCIVYENGSSDALYIGTDLGVFYRNAVMSDWISISDVLPNVTVTELEISYINNKIWAATYGRGLWSSPVFNNTPSWDCFTTSCVDPGTGNGFYTSLTDCYLYCLNSSVNTYEVLDVMVYPNPSRGIFNIEFTLANPMDITLNIINMLGQKITSIKIESNAGVNTYRIDLSNYAKGIYNLKLISEAIVFDEKIIIE